MLFAGLSETATAGLISQWSWSSKTGTPGVDVSGTATFSTVIAGSTIELMITVDNTADQLPTSTAQLLTGLYFNISPDAGALSMYSATADLGLLNNGTLQTSPTTGTANTNVCAPGGAQSALAPNATNCTLGGGWELAYNTAGIGGGAAATQHYGIGTTGQTGAFSGNAKTGAGAFDYSIAPGNGVGINPTSAGGLDNADDPTLSNGNNDHGYAYGEAVFYLTGLTTQNITIQNVTAAYGTAPEGTPAATNTTVSALPEPSSITMLLAGGAMLLGTIKRLRSRSS